MARATVERFVSGEGATRTSFRGYAELGDIHFADLDGDGVAEAVIPTTSLASGGSFGFLIYQAQPEPRLAVAYPGYKLQVQTHGGMLVVTEPFYAGHEGNCCPTGAVTRYLALADGALRPAAANEYDLFRDIDEAVTLRGIPVQVGPAELLVAAYYRAINARRHEVAWSLLSPEQQAREGSFSRFVAGFATTRRVEVAITRGDTFHTARVSILAEDEGRDPGITRTRLTGVWTISADAGGALGYLLDQAVIGVP